MLLTVNTSHYFFFLTKKRPWNHMFAFFSLCEMTYAWILHAEQNFCEWKPMVKNINPVKQKHSDRGGGWADGVKKRVSLHVYCTAYSDLFDSYSISFSHVCHYRQRTSVDSLYGSRNFSPSSANHLFWALPILNPQQASAIQEKELVVHIANLYSYFIRALPAFHFNNLLWFRWKILRAMDICGVK